MASAKAKMGTQIGSAQWIQNEREQAEQFVNLEVEEFGYSVRNEFEWLNEHMAEIFSKQQLNLTDVFKTPGKLRGKTPRTARKKDASVARAPLTDLFAPQPQGLTSPAQNTPFYNKIAQFKVAQDEVKEIKSQGSSRRSPLRTGKGNTDSGYHGMTEDEMEVDGQPELSDRLQQAHMAALVNSQQSGDTVADDEGRQTNDSFVSAAEDPESRDIADEVDEGTMPDETLHVRDDNENLSHALPTESTGSAVHIHEDEPADLEDDIELEDAPVPDDVHSPSAGSTPDQPLLRKSSLNFVSLPPRETLTAKRSLGFRNSQVETQHGRASVQTSAGTDHQEDDEDPADIKKEMVVTDGELISADHNKTSTQRLHDRINMLGQSKEPRASKISIPASLAALQQQVHDKAENITTNLPASENDSQDDDDDWIEPISKEPSAVGLPRDEQRDEEHSQARPTYGHQKSISTTHIASPTKASLAPEVMRPKATSVSHPTLGHASGQVGNQTPAASPNAKRLPDGPLSASKAKLYSVLKSAKGIFASSAGASAQAKMEALSSPTKKANASTTTLVSPSKMPGAFDDAIVEPKATGRPISIISSPSRKTRSSTESSKKHEKEEKDRQRADNDLDRIREKERKKATEQKQERENVQRDQAARVERERSDALERSDSQRSAVEEFQPQSTTKPSTLGKLRAPGRLMRPTKQPAQPAKPVNIRVASQSQRFGSVQPAGSASASAVADTNAAPATTRQQAAAAARSGSAQPPGTLKTAQSNSRLKALEVAARKKEQEEKAAQRKVEQKREIERKRAVKAEEEKRQEQERKAAEQQRIQDAKIAAQQQAEQRQQEQHRKEAAAQKAKADAELAAALKREAAQAHPAPPRGDVQGTLRQLGKTATTVTESSNGANSVKPVKRTLQAEHEEEQQQPQRPGLQRGPLSYQQQDAKRRRTDGNEDTDRNHERHSVMAPPKRPSNMRKENVTKFPHGYAHAPPPAAHHNPTMFKATVTAQHQLQHGAKAPLHPNDTIKVSNARIPFAENANPPAAYVPSGAPSTQSATGPFKTPARLQQNQSAPKTKSSPYYPNGENIALPEINTDSEDEEDSDDDEGENTGAFRAPSWVASPALRDLLTQQQLVDPESVFGPIAPLQMDEVFRNGKNAERLKRFRDRGSSARWVESGDAVTSAEKKKDREARAKVVRDGGWRFERDL